MFACERPQNSVHWPQNSPVWSAWKVMLDTRPGTASRLPFSAGIQNEWMTSRELMRTCTFCPTGITISFAVTMP